MLLKFKFLSNVNTYYKSQIEERSVLTLSKVLKGYLRRMDFGSFETVHMILHILI